MARSALAPLSQPTKCSRFGRAWRLRAGGSLITKQCRTPWPFRDRFVTRPSRNGQARREVYPVTTDDQEACGHAHNGAGRQAAARKEPTLVRRFGTMLLVALAVAAVAAPARAVGAFGGDDRIWYFQGAGGSWTRQRSPYRGVLMAAASDGTGAYLMYRASDGVHLAKRTPGGTFTAGRLLSDTTNRFIAGAVIATGGSWWAVWTEQTGQNRFGDPVYGLFQAKT